MAESKTSMSDFTVLSKLGTGAFSEVYKVFRKSDRSEYALKKVRLSKLTAKEKDNAINEVRILASLSHPNVAGYKEAFFEEATSSLCIVMDYANGGDLQTKINQLKKTTKYMPESTIWSIFFQMVTGLNCLHMKKIVHRDIKCANIFLTKDGTVMLGDLNVSKIAKAGVMQTQTGTPYYASPEVWKDQPYDKSSDIWSLGAVLYEMVALNPPFTARDMKGLYNKVVKGVYPKIPTSYSSDLSSMISSLLKVDPKKRPSTEQILHMPVFIAKYNESQQQEHQDEEEQGYGARNELLGTIKVPRNLSLLTERLPKSQYETDKPKEEHKRSSQPNLTAIQEEDDYKPIVGIKRERSVLDSNRKPPLVQQRHSRVESARLADYQSKQSHSDILVSNSLAQKQQKVISGQKPRQVSGGVRGLSGRRIPNTNINSAQSSPKKQRSNRQMLENQMAKQQQQQANVDQGDRNNDDDGTIQVRPYQKIYIQGHPGSCPTNRSGVDDLSYQQRYGKGPLIERAERIKKLQQVQKNISPSKVNLGEDQPQDYMKREEAILGPKQHGRPLASEEGYLKLMKDERVKRMGGMSALDQNTRAQPGGVARHYGYNEQEEALPSIDVSNNDINALALRGNPAAVAYQHYTPQQRYIKPPIHGGNQGHLMPPSINEMSALLPRTRSKDSLHMQNNLRNHRYGGGAANVLEQGRLESQRLVMERYRRIDLSEQNILHSANKPQNNKYSMYHQHGSLAARAAHGSGHGQVDSSRQYIPMSQKGQRPVKYGAVGGGANNQNSGMYNAPSHALLPNPASGSRPSWWG